jgi:hypothetical protein
MQETPPGRIFPINFDPFPILDKLQMDSKIWNDVQRLQNERAASAGGMHAEHF